MIVGIVSLLLALSFGGKDYAWGSWQIIGLFVLALVGIVGFVLHKERNKRDGAEHADTHEKADQIQYGKRSVFKQIHRKNRLFCFDFSEHEYQPACRNLSCDLYRKRTSGQKTDRAD